VDDRSAGQLDDERDRDELRQRYYGLLQEVRVLLPGVQILVAFLLTVPFATGFRQVDHVGRVLYGISLCAGFVAVIAFIAPTALHRMGHRQARSQRLVWSIRLSRVGLAFLGISLVAGLAVVMRDVFGDLTAELVVAGCVGLILIAWLALPLLVDTPNTL
jgi:Family of unknown function (DUF6328)